MSDPGACAGQVTSGSGFVAGPQPRYARRALRAPKSKRDSALNHMHVTRTPDLPDLPTPRRFRPPRHAQPPVGSTPKRHPVQSGSSKKRQKVPVDARLQDSIHSRHAGGASKSILPDPRCAEYGRAREKQIRISSFTGLRHTYPNQTSVRGACIFHAKRSLQWMWRA